MRSTILAGKRARRLRREMSPPEVYLWVHLRGRRPGKPVYRRQHPCGHYILDFYCPEARLAVEVDGWAHESRQAHDERRDAWLEAQGIKVIRIAASAVFEDSFAVAEWVWEQTAIALRAAAPSTAFRGPPPPSAMGED